MRKQMLIVDGAYFEKEGRESTKVKKKLKEILGERGYPTHLKYFTAGQICKVTKQKVTELDIPNIVYNTEGYIGTSHGKPIQKGVDILIAISILKEDFDDIYLLSGDGDLFPIAIEYSQIYDKKLIVFSYEGSTSKKLIENSEHYWLNQKNLDEEEILISKKVEDIIYKVWLTYTSGKSNKYLSSSVMGRINSQNPSSNLKKINKVFLELGKKEYIHVKSNKLINNKDLYISFNKKLSEDNLLLGGESIKDGDIIGTIIDEIIKSDKHYFFIQSGERSQDIYLNSQELTSNDLATIKIGSKVSFKLAKGKGKNAIARKVKVITNA